MRILHACAYVATTALAVACGGSDGAKPDAPPIVVPDAPAPDAFVPPQPDAQTFDFSCMGNAAPTTATPTIVISGTATGLDLNGMNPSLTPLDGATIDACTGNCVGPNKLDTQTTDANGSFTTSALATGGVPLDGFIKVSKATYRTSNIFPSAPLVADTAGTPALVFNDQVITALPLLGVSQSPTNGNVGLLVTDCANTPIMGANVTVQQNGADAHGSIVDASMFGQQGAGTYLVFDVPPGATEVGATYMGMTLRTHTVSVVMGETTGTQIRPGF